MADGPENKPAGNLSAPGLPRVRDPQFREIYANGSLTGLGPFDVTFTFTRTSESGQGVILVDQAAVTMSPQHFKNFVRSAIEALTAYENTFGVLQTPDEITAPGASAQQMEAMLKAARERAVAIVAAQSATTIASSSPTEKKRPSKRSRSSSGEKS